MITTYYCEPGVKIRLWEKVYAFDQDGRLSTDNEELQSALELSPAFLSGKITREGYPYDRAYKLYSHVLNEFIWVVRDREKFNHLKGIVYDAKEIIKLKSMDLTSDELKKVHEVKKVFGASMESEQNN